MNYSELISFDELYDNYLKCRRNVSWKPCVKSFDINALERIYKMNEELESGTWRNRTPRPIKIWYPKRRDGLSIPFRDRIYQRSLNDNVLYSTMSKSFIYENSACQTGKGTSHARMICKRNLNRMYINYGLNFYVGQIDIHQYYQTIPHKDTEAMYRKVLTDDLIYKAICSILRTQNNEELGYNPGSQMIQITGVSYLSPVDHFIKEQLRVKNYQRYMDDFLLFYPDYSILCGDLDKIIKRLNDLGFTVNPNKTHVVSIKEGFRFLGFDYRMTDTGKIIMTTPSDKVEHERRKLRREVILWSKGEISKSKIYEGLRSWKSTHKDGNTDKVFRHLDQYLKSLWEVYGNADTQKNQRKHSERS